VVSVGYERVSTTSQLVDSQQGALLNCERVFVDEGVSGTTNPLDRPGFGALLEYARAGDEIRVAALDRLARSASGLLQVLDVFEERALVLLAVREGIRTDGALGKLLATILAAMASWEVETIRARTREGLDAARARGVRLGRPSVMTDARRELAVRLRSEGESLAQIARALGVGKSTVHRALTTADDQRVGPT